MTINDLAWGLSETLRERQVNYAQHLFLDYVEIREWKVYF